MQAPPPIQLERDASSGVTFDAFADTTASARRPVRERTRRGGPRAPFPLLPIIGICAGIGLAYVAQTAHVTQTAYEATSAAAQQAQLQRQAASLSDELSRLTDPTRIDAAAQRLGLRPPGSWTYVAAVPPPIAAPVTTPDATRPAPTHVATHRVQAMVGTVGDGPRTVTAAAAPSAKP